MKNDVRAKFAFAFRDFLPAGRNQDTNRVCRVLISFLVKILLLFCICVDSERRYKIIKVCVIKIK